MTWSGRYPWIVEAARKIRKTRFVFDGEAVILGVDGVSDFNALHSRKQDDEVQFCAFDIMALDGQATLDHAQDRKASSSTRSSAARSGWTCFGQRTGWG